MEDRITITSIATTNELKHGQSRTTIQSGFHCLFRQRNALFVFSWLIALFLTSLPRRLLIVLPAMLATIAWSACDETVDDATIPLHLSVMYPLAGLGDRSYADTVYEGIVRARMEIAFTKTQITPLDLTEAQAVFDSWIAAPLQGKELIITVAESYKAIVAAAKCQLGGHYVVHIDNSLPSCPGLKSATYRTYGPSFLAGVGAMQVAPHRTAATIGGMDIPAVNEFMQGFEAGVRHAGGIIVASEYLSDKEDGFYSPDKARAVAQRLFQQADVIFPVAGGSGPGVFEAAKEQANRYVIGVDVDQSWLGRGIVIGSVVKKMQILVLQAVREIATDTFQAGQFSLGLEEQGVDFLINEVFQERVEAAVNAARPIAAEAATNYFEQNPW